jgi:hypothetical protein
MLRRIVSLRLYEIILWVLHELAHGLRTAEAIGFAKILPIDGAVGLYWWSLTAGGAVKLSVEDLAALHALRR